MQKPLVEKKYLLQKFPGKGGWTYAMIPEILQSKHSHFGWVKVKGFIDDHEIKNYHLMPMGNGHLFLPVKAEIRKKIKKQEGDFVHVILFADESDLEIPEAFLTCLSDEPVALQKFSLFTNGEKKAYVDWIFSTKKEETQVERIATAIKKIAVGKKLNDTKF